MREIVNTPVSELMSKPVVTVKPETTIEELTELMQLHDYNGIPVVNDGGALVGLVTRTDLFKVYLLPYRKFIPVLEDTWVRSVGAIMSRGVVTLYPSEPVIKAMALMADQRVRTIPIVTDTTAGTTVIGILTRRDVARALKP